MRPLAELDADVRGVVFDVDDTVTRDGKLERIAFDAMWRMADAGLDLVPITGRPLGWSDLFARMWPVRLAAGENGAGWAWSDDEGFHVDYFESTDTRARSLALVEEIRAEMPELRVSSDDALRRCEVAIDVGEHESVPADVVSKLVARVEAAGGRAPVSSVHCHIAFGGWNKAVGAAKAIESVLGSFDAAAWVFVGDSGNDAEAFAAFPHSVGVANVVEHLHRLSSPPRYVTRASHGAGFAELADHLLARHTQPG